MDSNSGFLEADDRWIERPLAHFVDPVADRVIDAVVIPSLFPGVVAHPRQRPVLDQQAGAAALTGRDGRFGIGDGDRSRAALCFCQPVPGGPGDIATGALYLEKDTERADPISAGVKDRYRNEIFGWLGLGLVWPQRDQLPRRFSRGSFGFP